MSGEKVFVRNFLAQGVDIAHAINLALREAEKQGGGVVELEEGFYPLHRFQTIETLSIAHDDGCGDISRKDCHVVLRDLHGITLRGAVHPDGSPATILAGMNHQRPQELLPSILWAENCRGLTVENIAFTRHPQCASAGIVTAVEGDSIQVEVRPGLPCQDNMGAYCMNRFDPAENRLLGASLTWGFGFDTRWQKIGQRTLVLRDERLAGLVNLGEGLSWHQAGRTDFQVFFGGCSGLRLCNLRVYNTNSFAILTENCRDIHAEKLVIRPAQGQFFCGPRDGWKIYRCSGKIALRDCHIEGVRMDGQNVHSNYLVLQEILSGDVGIFTCKYAPVPLEVGATVRFGYGGDESEAEIVEWSVLERAEDTPTQAVGEGASAVVPGRKNYSTRYQIAFSTPVLQGKQAGTLAEASCWTPGSYSCQNSVFRNIAGAGQLLRCSNIHISGCSYTNIMNAGILMGAELDTHSEAGHCSNVVVENCTFDNCGFYPRYGQWGCGGIAVKSQGFSGPYNKDMRFAGNRFINCATGMELRDCGDILGEKNQFQAVEHPVLADEKTTKEITMK